MASRSSEIRRSDPSHLHIQLNVNLELAFRIIIFKQFFLLLRRQQIR
jgi:hypothetical protein